MQSHSSGEGVQINGVLSGARTCTANYTVYVSPYTVVSNGGQMSKHIYIGSQRIVSKLIDAGTMDDPRNTAKATYTGNSLNYNAKYATQTATVKSRYEALGVIYRGKDNAGAGFYTAVAPPAKENSEYFYHSDHLGSSSLITDIDGNLVQHIEYIPFGEVFIDERTVTNKWSTPYKFNAKELDDETGLYYYGARYYDPRTSVWISVDPLAEKMPSVGSYVYCFNNPIIYRDPDGKWPGVTFFFDEKNIGAGFIGGRYIISQSGYAFDEYGTTMFRFSADITPKDAKWIFEDANKTKKNATYLLGLSGGYSLGVGQSTAETFEESVEGASVSTPGPDIHGKLGLGVGFSKNSFSLTIGIQAGLMINVINLDVYSLSMSDEEYSNYTTPDNFKVTLTKVLIDKSGVVGYAGKINVIDKNNNTVSLDVRCGVSYKNNKIEPNNVWMTDSYFKIKENDQNSQ